MIYDYTPPTSFSKMNTKESIKRIIGTNDAAAAALLLSKKQNSRLASSRLISEVMASKTKNRLSTSASEAALPPSEFTTPKNTLPGNGSGTFGEYQESDLEIVRPKESEKKSSNKTLVIVLVVVAVVVIGYLIWKKPWKKATR